ncbi:MAG: hypothetical protein K2N64_01015 [Anaeroplasmataceae bacterium]|nr:hypothetical protein [Anaeroplasmataceae bacterium]
MKKIILLCLIILGLTGCKSAIPNFNNQLPMKKVSIEMGYEEGNKKASPICSIDLQNAYLYSKSNYSKKINALIGGDELEIYYKDENYESIDHILVEEACHLVVEATNEIVPGSNRMDLFVPDSDEIILNCFDIKYIIHSDGTYEALQTAKTGQKLYATYQKKDIVKTSEFSYLYKILAVYSYNPRP